MLSLGCEHLGGAAEITGCLRKDSRSEFGWRNQQCQLGLAAFDVVLLRQEGRGWGKGLHNAWHISMGQEKERGKADTAEQS